MSKKRVGKRGEVLIAILNNELDLALLRSQNWYRIPVDNVQRLLGKNWPPQRIAFYQTQVFKNDAYKISYYGDVERITISERSELFPDEPISEKSKKLYYRIQLKNVNKLQIPITSQKGRRIVFIPTTFEKFDTSIDINDLFHESPLEDSLWSEFKKFNINAERQLFISTKNRNYFLDFAVFCVNGKIDIETDGDTWHSKKENIASDNFRDNELQTIGWNVLRFNGKQIKTGAASYCIEAIAKTINNYGGIEEHLTIPRKILLEDSYQPPLFD